ncbi:MAG: glycosyltransferase [Bacteroidales bacterium]|nr:glycosyltransferase [Bacteroidales bacterium]
MTKISAAIIARNNEKEISTCIKSIKGVDEIIVLDTGSNDKTASIATSLGAKVFYSRWEDDFSIARNRVLDYTQHPWILSIDTDEVMTTTVDSMYKLLNENFSKRAISTPISDKEKTFWGLRLFRKASAHWIGEIHEELSIQPDLYSDEVKIWHTPSPNHQTDPLRNITILRRVLEKKPTSPRDIFFLGLELHAIGQWDAALYWMQYYTIIAPKTANYTAEIYYQMADCYCKLHRVNRGIESLMKAVEVNPQMKCAYEKLSLLTKEQRWEEKAKTATNYQVMVIR